MLSKFVFLSRYSRLVVSALCLESACFQYFIFEIRIVCIMNSFRENRAGYEVDLEQMKSFLVEFLCRSKMAKF
jgi:hypothetical protein